MSARQNVNKTVTAAMGLAKKTSDSKQVINNKNDNF